MNTLFSSVALFFIAPLCFFLPFSGSAKDQGFFPEVGREAVHQRALDLSSNAVVLIAALQPGYEDLNMIAQMRLGVGAKTIVLYWTNGEATPSDAEGASPGLLAAERREEAFRAASLLGAQAHYLNLPDPGAVSRREELDFYWNPDSTIPKLVQMIRSYGPDVIVIGGDFREGTPRSLRQRALTELILKATKLAAAGKKDSIGAGFWRVHRVLVQSEHKTPVKNPAYDKVHPLWKRSYRSMALDAVREYRTLRYQLPSWLSRGDRRYSQVLPASGSVPGRLTAGVPFISPRLKPLAPVVRRAAGSEVKGVRSSSLQAVGTAIDSLNRFLARYRATLANSELRVVASWKNGLEDLRCSLLDVAIGYQSSDSLVTASQLFYLKFTGFSSRTSKTHTKIYFPGVMEKKWGVNESSTYQHGFSAPQEYRIITPTPMDYNVPGSQFGIMRPFARNRFSFLIHHQDSLLWKDFIYRGEVLLQSGPRRTFELLTPAVRALEGEPVVYRLLNITRDAFEGSMSLADSILNSASRRVFLEHKDEVLVDTLRLSFKEPPPAGTSRVTLTLSGEGGSIPVVIRKFEAVADSAARIALFSEISDSPLTQAMRRLRLPFVHVTSVRPDILGSSNVLVVDRDVLAVRPLSAMQVDSLNAWVRRGGHLLLFPQSSSSDQGTSLVPWAGFQAGPSIAPGDSLVLSRESELLNSPNSLTADDWSNWVISRSMSPLRIDASQSGVNALAETVAGDLPLLATRKEGAGRITLVALDLSSQLMNMHPGAHRLLGNLLRGEK